jgi:hypothetical protein
MMIGQIPLMKYVRIVLYRPGNNRCLRKYQNGALAQRILEKKSVTYRKAKESGTYARQRKLEGKEHK